MPGNINIDKLILPGYISSTHNSAGGYREMDEQDLKSCTAFEGNRCIASGNLLEVAKKVKEVIDRRRTGINPYF